MPCAASFFDNKDANPETDRDTLPVYLPVKIFCSAPSNYCKKMNALLDEPDLTEISEADCIDNHKRDKRKLGMSSYIKADSFKNKMCSQELYSA